MASRTYSDQEAADIIRGSSTRSDIEWLHRHLRGDDPPQLPGYKVGRKWRMTEADIEQAIELLRPQPATPVAPRLSSLTPTSRRRLGLG